MKNFLRNYFINKPIVKCLKNLLYLVDLFIETKQEVRKKNHSNQFVRYGKKCFSQFDEDGITIEIIKRLKTKKEIFLNLVSEMGWKIIL